MEKVVDVYQETKEKLDQYGEGDDMNIEMAQAEQFEYANAKKRISHS